MLKIYKELFNDLNSKNINYCIYKGLNHLNEDLNGDRGDIDILIDENDIAKFEAVSKSQGFYRFDFFGNRPLFYFKLDMYTHKLLQLDIDYFIRLGNRPNMEFYMPVEFKKLKLSKYKNINVLAKDDYLPLMFLMRLISNKGTQQNFTELKEQLKTTSIKESYMTNLLNKKFGISWKNIENDILKNSSWASLSNYKKNILTKTFVDSKLKLMKKFKYYFRIKLKLKSILEIPKFRIRDKGHLIAFIGVDGAGKSSTVDYIENLDYFKYTGIKRIYFGNNEYWIPGLTKLLQKGLKNRILTVALGTLALIDRQLRVLIALYYMYQGNIVLADRYIYDDEIGRERNKEEFEKKSLIKKIYHKIFAVRMLRKPDLTIFLDVSPDVAYTRKQDYSYETMLKVNEEYKNYMSQVEDVLIVNADNSQEKIYNDIIQAIIELDKNVKN